MADAVEWRINMEHCTLPNFFFCLVPNVPDATTEAVHQTYLEYFSSIPDLHQFTSSGEKYGFVYFEYGKYGLVPSLKVATFMDKSGETNIVRSLL